jgi:hypothetical protein
MHEEEKNAFLHDLYYDKKFAKGRDAMFFHISKTLNIKDISRRYIARWLAKQEAHQLHTQRKPQTNIRPIITNRPGAMLQMDLIDFSNKPANKYRYILNVIDTFSRKIWLNEIRNKTIKDVIPALNNIIQDIQKDYKINIIQSDNGPEFNISFPNIKHIQSRAYTPQQQGLVERSNSTVKTLLNRIMEFEKSKNWSKYLNQVEETYNDSYNRSIKTTPNNAYKLTGDEQDKLHEVQKNIKSKAYKDIDKVLEVGDTVRVLVEVGKQKSKGEPNWTRELYTISKVIKGNAKKFTIPRYKIIDEEGKIQKNTFPLSKLLYIPGVESK